MTPSDEIWRDFHLDDNCVLVEGVQKIRVYFSQIRRALTGLRGAAAPGAGTTNVERRAIDGFVERLQQTYEVLALRHFFGEGALKVDATESGFVHFSTLLELAADLERRDEKLGELPTVGVIKRRMLDEIVEHGLHPRSLQHDMMRRLYVEALAPQKLVKAFVPGSLEKVGKKDDPESWFWSFATYDRAANRPYLYLIYFAFDPDAGALTEDSTLFAEIRGAAESCAGSRINLLGFSNRLDDMVVPMSPRIVKRIALGPYLAPHFTRLGDGEDREFSELLASLDEKLPFALHWETETLISERETRVGAGWLSKGQLRQVFWIPRDLDLRSRGVSQLERFVVLPHWLAQQVDSAGLLPDRQRLAIEEGGETG